MEAGLQTTASGEGQPVSSPCSDPQGERPPGRRLQETEPNQRLTKWQISKDGESHNDARSTLRGKLSEHVSVCWSLQSKAKDAVMIIDCSLKRKDG